TQDWRANSAALGRLDLNRPLPRYPAPAGAGVITDLVGFEVAQKARQQLAEDIFLRLRAVTGVGDLATLTPGTPAFNAARWLAQLAVNIVDYLDADDYHTPFNWWGTEWVFGTELPRLVLNEVYAEWRRQEGEEGIEVKLWVELHNPLFADDSLSDAGAARLKGADGQNRPYGIYQLVVTETDPNPGESILQRPENVRGDPDPGAIPSVLDFADLVQAPDRVEPANGQPNRGFYVVGPD